MSSSKANQSKRPENKEAKMETSNRVFSNKKTSQIPGVPILQCGAAYEAPTYTEEMNFINFQREMALHIESTFGEIALIFREGKYPVFKLPPKVRSRGNAAAERKSGDDVDIFDVEITMKTTRNRSERPNLTLSESRGASLNLTRKRFMP